MTHSLACCFDHGTWAWLTRRDARWENETAERSQNWGILRNTAKMQRPQLASFQGELISWFSMMPRNYLVNYQCHNDGATKIFKNIGKLRRRRLTRKVSDTYVHIQVNLLTGREFGRRPLPSCRKRNNTTLVFNILMDSSLVILGQRCQESEEKRATVTFPLTAGKTPQTWFKTVRHQEYVELETFSGEHTGRRQAKLPSYYVPRTHTHVQQTKREKQKTDNKDSLPRHSNVDLSVFILYFTIPPPLHFKRHMSESNRPHSSAIQSSPDLANPTIIFARALPSQI